MCGEQKGTTGEGTWAADQPSSAPSGPYGIHVLLGNLGLEMESLPELASYKVLCGPEAFCPGGWWVLGYSVWTGERIT